MPAIIFALRIIIASCVNGKCLTLSTRPRTKKTLGPRPLQGRLRHGLGRRRLDDLGLARFQRVEALRACRAAPKPEPMASTPLEAEALALLEKQREGLSWSVSETDASGRPMPI